MEKSSVSGSKRPPPRNKNSKETLKGRVNGVRRGGAYCSVVNCHHNQSQHGRGQVKFYYFPKDERWSLWTQAIKRNKEDGSPWTPSSCMKHFRFGYTEFFFDSIFSFTNLFSSFYWRCEEQYFFKSGICAFHLSNKTYERKDEC